MRTRESYRERYSGLGQRLRFVLGLATVAALAVVTGSADAQGGRGRGFGAAAQKAPGATPIHPDSLPDYVRRTPPTDAMIQRIWEEGMERSQAASLSQVLVDSIGPRLTGSPGMDRGQDWLLSVYKKFGVEARKEQYGTWNSWKRGAAFAQMTEPRVKPLEVNMLSWSGSTGGKWEEAQVIAIKPYATPDEFRAWLPSVKGKIVLASAPRLTCRAPMQVAQFSMPATQVSLDSAQAALGQQYAGMTSRVRTFYDDVKAAGAVAVFESNFSNFPGIDKIFGSPRNSALPTFDVSCEDYGMLFRMATNNQGPKVRLMAESEHLGERPVFNVVAEIKGAVRPNEYVLLSAHFDSWEGSGGATDNGTGTITMLEALRIIKATLPRPSRTILVGHWSGEEQGLNGSGAFAADHPEVLSGLQFAFNQDNGTGRIISMGPSVLPENGPILAGYLSAMPAALTQWIRLQGVSGVGGGSDHASFLCHGAPAVNLSALGWDYNNTTWHTNRDSYDKIMQDDLKQNATLTAMLVYLSSEDPNRSSRKLADPLPGGRGGQPGTLQCGTVNRSSQTSNR